MAWLKEFLTELKLEAFLLKFSTDLRIFSSFHLDYVCDKDLERIGLNAVSVKRFLDAVNRKYRYLQSKDAADKLCGAVAANKAQDQTPKCIDASSVELSLYETLGTSSLGLLRRAEWKPQSEKMPVAARVIHNDLLVKASGSLAGSVMCELNKMRELKHPNVLPLFGVCLSMPTPLILSEYSEMGSVKSHLLTKAGAFGEFVMTVRMILAYAIQTVHALNYLEHKSFVHGNVAACNVMLFTPDTIKIGDYGVGRIVQPRVDFVQKRGAWFAPESFESNTFDHATDSWMFGVMLWEMFSAGADPWSNLTLAEVRQYLFDGCRLQRPAHCPDQIYDAMVSCWSFEPAERSKFTKLLSMLNEISFPVLKAYGNSSKDELEILNGDDIIVTKGGADSVVWTGQNKRTGSVGQFSRSLLLQTANFSPPIDSVARCSERSNVKSLINLHVDDIADGDATTGSDVPAVSASRAGWETFDSTTDLSKPQSQRAPTSVVAIKVDCPDVDVTNGYDLKGASTGLANAKGNKAAVARQEVRGGGSGGGYGFPVGNGSFTDVSDCERLLPPSTAARVTSLSEPNSPAHRNTARNRLPLRGGPVENISFDYTDGEPAFGRSLTAVKAADRLNWTASVSCENLDSVGSAKRPLGHTLSANSVHFSENLSKSSSDSHMYVDRDLASGAAPPVPPRDYSKRSGSIRLTAAQPRPSIHPILQDGHKRSSTHYFLLPEKQQLDASLPCSAAHLSDQQSPYINMTDGQWRRSGGRSASKSPTAKRGAAVVDGGGVASSSSSAAANTGSVSLSDLSKPTSLAAVDDESHASMGEVYEKIEQVEKLLGVESVCADEILTALNGHQWSVDESVRYLKVEHLFRLGLAPRPFCRAVLEAHSWQLAPAASALVDRCRRS